MSDFRLSNVVSNSHVGIFLVEFYQYHSYKQVDENNWEELTSFLNG